MISVRRATTRAVWMMAEEEERRSQILMLSIEGNIVPTLSFNNATGYVALDAHGVPLDEERRGRPKSAIRSRYIATSLYNRLLPRWHFLVQEQEKRQINDLVRTKNNEGAVFAPKYAIPPQTSIFPTGDADTSLPPLHLLAGASDEIFCHQLRLSLGEYLALKEEPAPRLKFGSQLDVWLRTGHPINLTSTA